MIVKKPPNLSRTVFKTATQNQITVYAFVSSNLFTQLNTLTELTNNFASVSFIILQCRNENILMSSKLHTFSITVFFENWYFSMILFPKLYTVFPHSYNARLVCSIECWLCRSLVSMSSFIVLWIGNWNLILEWEEKSGRRIGIFTMLESESHDDNIFLAIFHNVLSSCYVYWILKWR